MHGKLFLNVKKFPSPSVPMLFNLTKYMNDCVYTHRNRMNGVCCGRGPWCCCRRRHRRRRRGRGRCCCHQPSSTTSTFSVNTFTLILIRCARTLITCSHSFSSVDVCVRLCECVCVFYIVCIMKTSETSFLISEFQ